MFAYSTMSRAWRDTLDATRVRPLRPYDMRHIFASLLITAGKNLLYVSRQMGHHSPAFSFTVYGHLMESLPRQQVEWIDELVFPEGFETALNLHLSGAPQGATTRSPVQSGQPSEPLKNAEFAAACSSAQSDTWLREGAGTKMHVLVPVARRKRSGLDSGDGRALGYVSGVP